MTREDVTVGTLIAFGVAVTAMLLCWPSWAQAVDCPKEMRACKVIVVSPEQADSMKMLIENTALNGPYNQLKEAVRFYGELIDKAPAGTPVAADPPKPAPAPEPKK